MKPALALYQPDIPQNAGTLLRLGACLDVAVHIIHPAGFRLDDRAFRRAGLDYLDRAALTEHGDWDAFDAWRRGEARRLVLLTTSAETSLPTFEFAARDVLLMGRESAGVPGQVHDAADARIRIPLMRGARSLNVALAASMGIGEALRQTRTYPADD